MSEAADIQLEGDIFQQSNELEQLPGEQGASFKTSADHEGRSSEVPDDAAYTERSETEGEGEPQYHQVDHRHALEEAKQQERDFRKRLNRDARQTAADSVHRGIRLIVHRPDYSVQDQEAYLRMSKELFPIIREIASKTLPLLQHDESPDFSKNRYYGSRFQADHVAYGDYRYFAQKRPPSESPSLVVGLRVDESASMSAFGRLEAAKRAVLAVYEFCRMSDVPVLIYGDTADVSRLEQMSVFAYADGDRTDDNDRFRLMTIAARSNNRDGLALRIISERLVAATQQTKLLISISDGQPKAMENYTGSYAMGDMRRTIEEYERKGITFLAAAIGHDKELIGDIYGQERFLDITDLKEFPAKLVRTIARYL